jgi:hypothetical protein
MAMVSWAREETVAIAIRSTPTEAASLPTMLSTSSSPSNEQKSRREREKREE